MNSLKLWNRYNNTSRIWLQWQIQFWYWGRNGKITWTFGCKKRCNNCFVRKVFFCFKKKILV